MTTEKRLILLVIILSLFFPALSGGEPNLLYGTRSGKVAQNLTEGIKKIDLYLFHSEECGSCKSIIPGLTERLETMYPSLRIKLLDLKDPGNYEALRNLERSLGQRGE